MHEIHKSREDGLYEAMQEPGFRAWYESRPECVKKLIIEYPPMSKVTIHNKHYWVFGYTEDNKLIISKINPSEDYENAIKQKNRKYICISHFNEKK